MRHRSGLAAAGTVLTCLGTAGLVAGRWAASRPLVDRAADRYVAAHDWFWPVVGLAAWGSALIGVVWLILQIRAVVARRVALMDGTARMLMRAASRGLAADIRGLPGVGEVRVRFTGSAHRPVLRLWVVCDETAGLGALRDQIAAGPLTRFRHLTDMPDLLAVIRFRVAYHRRCVV